MNETIVSAILMDLISPYSGDKAINRKDVKNTIDSLEKHLDYSERELQKQIKCLEEDLLERNIEIVRLKRLSGVAGTMAL